MTEEDLERGIWVVVHEGLATHTELKTTMYIEDFVSAVEYLEAKAAAEKRAAAEAESRAGR